MVVVCMDNNKKMILMLMGMIMNMMNKEMRIMVMIMKDMMMKNYHNKNKKKF